MAMKMRQSLAQMEREFLYEAEQDQKRREHLQRRVHVRARQRTQEREKKRSSIRFYLLVFTLIATALIVTAAMFETLYLLLT
jgi:membrane glycosyltransferase